MIPEARLSVPWFLLFLILLAPLHWLAPQQFALLLWAGVQISFAVVLWFVIVGQINHTRIPLNFGNLESAILLAAMVIAVRLGF